MKQQLRLPILLLTCAIAIGSLSSAQAQKAPVRKPAARATTGKPQGLTMEQLLHIDNLTDLPPVDDYLTARDWRFGKSQAEENHDKVTYLHKSPNGSIDASLSIYFCNDATNKFCYNQAIHSEQKRQHVFGFIYMPSKYVYDKLKAEVRTATQLKGSTVKDDKITTIYEGNGYRFNFSIDTSDGTTDYLISYKELEQEIEDLE